MRILALDPGTVRIGVAVSDALGITAQPRDFIPAGDPAGVRRRVEQIVREDEVAEVIVGHPLRMDGAEGPAALEARKFADDLRTVLGVPVTLRDERLTTKQAARRLSEGGASKRQKKASTDAVAAQILLQAYLEEKRVTAPGA